MGQDELTIDPNAKVDALRIVGKVGFERVHVHPPDLRRRWCTARDRGSPSLKRRLWLQHRVRFVLGEAGAVFGSGQQLSKHYPHLQAAPRWRPVEADPCAVAVGDRLHDGQPQASAAGC